MKGYVSHSKNDSNDLNMQGWRTVYLPVSKCDLENANPAWGGVVHVKQIKTGVLVDLSSALPEKNDPVKNTPIYPSNFSLNIHYYAGTAKKTIPVQKSPEQLQEIIEDYAGMVFIETTDTISNQLPVSAELSCDAYGKNKVSFTGQEKEFMLNFKDACVKSNIDESVPLSMSSYLNKASLEVYCSRFGVPFSGEVEVQLDTFVPVNSDAIDAYSEKNSTQ